MSKPLFPSEKSRSKNLLEELQSSFIRRFSKTPLSQEPIVYEFTNDRALLHQYYRMREAMYRKVLKLDNFKGDEDVYDKLSHILIARRGKLCVGGCRLTVREADEDFLLPMESEDFKLRNVFPNLPLRKLCHGEISRFAVLDEDDEHLEIMLALSQLIAEKCINSGLGFAFLRSSLPMARKWRKVGQNHLKQKVRICTEIKVPEDTVFTELAIYLTVASLPASEAITTPYEDILAQPIDSLVH